MPTIKLLLIQKKPAWQKLNCEEKIVKNDKVVIINGRKYSVATGLPVAEVSTEKSLANSIIKRAQGTYLVKAAKKPISQGVALARKVGRTMDVARSKSISRFSPKPTSQQSVSNKPKSADIGPTKHPIISRIENAKKIASIANLNKPEPPKSPKEIKEAAMKESLKHLDQKPSSKKTIDNKYQKIINITTAIIALLVIIGYFIYIYLPSFSVKVASIQAGIDASFPEYHPDGYKVDGPVTYKNGEVTINFHANTGNTSYVIKQSKSSWDSSAVKASAQKESKGDLSTTSERGLTIFSYDNKAMWVNGGILYTISGDAPLSSDQIRRIATSL